MEVIKATESRLDHIGVNCAVVIRDQ